MVSALVSGSFGPGLSPGQGHNGSGSLKFFLLLLFLSLFILVLTAPAECSSYSKLSDASRASGTHRGRVLKCDHYDLAVGWYRFTDAAGTRMPTSPVAINHCGTHAPGWMNGQHPTKDDGSVKRKVCFNWNNNVCLWNIEISVRNCGAFYVYQLPRIPYCYLRYCGNQGHSTYSKIFLSLILRCRVAISSCCNMTSAYSVWWEAWWPHG